ncbi:hypothetical protein AXG93_777s1100 [Marchantia polymorpha subsp. ruderalis]|uniref:Peroxidase n=2 Tax=Marchantia polymorpha TaxID=3197 RepID=A0A176VQM9_MARPO|nr:hypothetical protein AXG93_777s1100 [Marchantia polymorpha subsp. ruderalis]
MFLAASTLVVHVQCTYGVGGGLMVGFYDGTCPSAEALVKATVESAIASDKRNGAGLVRTFFHDCFVEGCDASVLIDSTPDNSAEKDGRPNLTLHGFEFIDMAKASIEAACPGVVSCADIVAIAARDSVHLLGGPYYEVKTGRRDGRVSLASGTSDIPNPIDDLATLTSSFAKKGLSQSQMVSLSGLHTIGKATCGAFTNRLYNFSSTASTDPTLDAEYAEQLKAACPPGSETGTTVVDMDVATPELVDNQYYVGLVAHKGLFTSDEVLYTSAETQPQVLRNAQSAYSWTSEVVRDLTAMGDVEVKTGSNGEIRLNCRVINP